MDGDGADHRGREANSGDVPEGVEDEYSTPVFFMQLGSSTPQPFSPSIPGPCRISIGCIVVEVEFGVEDVDGNQDKSCG